MAKIARSGSEGNMRLLKSYGGGSTPPRQSYAKGYATGGAVRGDNPSLTEGISASGSPAKANLSKPGRKAPGKAGKKGGTNVNVIVMPKGGDDKPPMDAGAMPMGGPAGGAMAPPMLPPGGGAGPAGGMPPMRKHGGKVGTYAKGGRVKKADGGPTISEDSKNTAKNLRQSADDVSVVDRSIVGALPGLALRVLTRGRGAIAKSIPESGAAIGALLGGISGVDKRNALRSEADRIEKDQAKPGEEDRKRGGRIGKSVGGPAMPPKGFDAGAGGGLGRLEKIKRLGK